MLDARSDVLACSHVISRSRHPPAYMPASTTWREGRTGREGAREGVRVIEL